MSNSVFITHVDWKVKRPFISYSDEQFIKEIDSINIESRVDHHEYQLQKPYRKYSSICNYFIKYKRKIDRQKLLEKKESSTLQCCLLKCFGL